MDSNQGNGAAKDELAGDSIEAPHPLPAANGHMLNREERARLVRQALGTDDQDHEDMLGRVKARFDRSKIRPRTIEIRFDNLTVQASAYVGSRSQPNILNFYRNVTESVLQQLRLLRPSKAKVKVLNQVSGVLKPGRLTLLLGPPGGGKSTLLRALAGRMKYDGMKVTGSITYNGRDFSHFVPEQTATFVNQSDLHLPEMTVRETLDHGARMQGIGFRGEEEKELAGSYGQEPARDDSALDLYMKAAATEGKRESIVTDHILRILGMDVCADTPIGNEMIRGISGGQKKRVTLGEKLVGPKQVLLLDSISTGLDSATTFQIIKALRDFCHLREATVLISLLQPTPETYGLFDDLLLLAEGRQIYFGPVADVEEFFAGTGFRCPPRTDVSDFLQEVTSRKDQPQYWAGDKAYSFVPVSAFEDAFNASGRGQDHKAALQAPPHAPEGDRKAFGERTYAVNSKQAFKALMHRDWLLMKRNMFVYAFKAVQVAVVGVITATLFIRTHIHNRTFQDANLIAGFLFFAVIQLYFGGIAEITFTIDRLPVFYRQRESLFFPSWAFVMPTSLLRVPVSLLESFCWSVITYWVVGLSAQAGRFFVFWLIGFLIHHMAVSLFRAIGAVSRNLTVANALGTLVMLVMVMLGGFVLTKPYVHPWWIWAYWINPMQFSQRALLINEFSDPRWSEVAGPDGRGLGTYLLASKGLPNTYWWIWVAVGVNILAIFIFNVVIVFCNQYLPDFDKQKVAVTEEALAESQATSTGSTEGAPAGADQVAVDMPEEGQVGGRHSQESSRGSFKTPKGSAKVLSAAERKAAFKSFNQKRSSRTLTGSNTRLPVGSQKNLDVEAPAGSPKEAGALESDRSIQPDVDQGMVLPFEPVVMTFKDVHYWVNCPPGLDNKSANVTEKGGKPMLELLCGISGAFRPGFMTCLMGVSGAGKTTLMDVLAGRKTGGVIEGDVRINGHPKVQETFTRVSGYVEQTDVHNTYTTVQEALEFSAALRISDTSKEILQAFVAEIMELVELTSLRNLVVGGSLSAEQTRRLSIAVELVSNPAIVFMDEPTSGLDARAAAVVIRVVRNIVNTGRTIVCTIHQPSLNVFETFDELLLIKQGGRVIFSGLTGKESCNLIAHFEHIDGVPPIQQGHNPATWMLEISGTTTERNLGIDFADIYDRSDLAKSTHRIIEQASMPAEGSQPLAFKSRFAHNFFEQFIICTKRSWITNWRNDDYNATRFYFTVLVALVSGTIYWKLGKNTSTEQSISNALGALLVSSTFLAIVQCILVQPVMSSERAVMYRERAAGIYNVMAWYLGIMTVEFFYLLLQAIVFTCVVYFSAGFQKSASKFFWFVWWQYLSLLYWTLYGALAVAVTPHLIGAAVISAAFYAQSYLFSGFVIAEASIPGWWVWVFWFNPVQWSLRGLLSSQMGDITDQQVALLEGGSLTPQQFIYQRYGFKHSWLGYCCLVLLAWIVVLLALTGFALKRLNFQSK